MARSKYRNVRTEYRGVPYDSKAEAARAFQLDLMLRAGEIAAWQRQITICLGVPENRYRVDFLVWDRDGRTWAEDVKGVETGAFRRNARLWKRYGPCPLRVIRKGGAIDIITPEHMRGTI